MWNAPQSKNTANNGLKYHAGRLLATYESGSAYELALTPELTTTGLCDFGGTLGTNDFWLDNMTAHGKTCAETGEMMYIGYNLIDINADRKTEVTVGVVDADGKRARRVSVPVARPSMQHDVGITRTRVVLLDGPLVFNLNRVMDGGLPFAFEGEETMRIGILPRKGAADASDAVWIDTEEPCYAYHVVNCYDDPTDANKVIVDACKADGTNALGMARGFDKDAPNGYAVTDAGFVAGVDRDRPIEAGAVIGRHANAVGEGRDVAAMWRWVVDVKSKTLVSSTRTCSEPSGASSYSMISSFTHRSVSTFDRFPFPLTDEHTYSAWNGPQTSRACPRASSAQSTGTRTASGTAAARSRRTAWTSRRSTGCSSTT